MQGAVRDVQGRGRRWPGLISLVVALALAAALPLSSAGAGGTNWWEATTPLTPDSQVNAVGEPFRGVTASGEVRGYIDAHTHMFSNLGFGGNIVCGKTYSTVGVDAALKDCPAHYPDGKGALVENLTDPAKGGDLFATHDPDGWPNFADWPTYSSLTHQQMYYKWVERAWRGGQRIMVNHLVSNTGLCSINGIVNPPNTYPCDDMDAVRREAAETYKLQDFIDAQFGGPGKGWFRVVTSPEQAREVVAAGKLAVVLGVEVSEPFGCKQNLGIPGCSKSDIDRGLDELYGLGVRTMFLCHKFDNALCGVRYDSGTTGIIVNLGQFITTGTWWNPRTCQAGETPDNTVEGGVLAPELSASFPLAVLPIYPKGPHCNPRGLTDLGEYAVKGMIKRGMVIELDHMSAKAADRAFDLVEEAGYPGLVSSHSWMSEDYMDRLYRSGGFVAQYGHTAAQFVGDWARTKPIRDQYGVGYGYGMDMNGFGGTPAPRLVSGAPPVTYPFTSFDGGTSLTRQISGNRVWDYNTDGVAHYGMIPDWIEDLRGLGGAALINDLARGAQSYLTTWSAADGYTAQTNLARGKAAKASSTEWSLFGSFVAGKAVDGSMSTRWASEWSDAQWLQVDLGSAQRVGRVAVHWEAAYGKAFRVETSTDGSTWTTRWSTAQGRGGLDVASYSPVTARYVRIVGTARGTRYGYSVHEMGVYAG